MKVFVLVGDIVFTDDTAYVRKVAYGAHISNRDLSVLDSLGYDYILPHYYEGRIVFDQYHDEDWHTSRDLLIEKLDREEREEKIQARRDADY